MLKRVVYQYWTGEDMPPARKACFDATRDVFGVPVELITDANLKDYVVPGHPLHPCFDALAVTHRSDYIRCYLAQFHGGGWADIKKFSPDNNWAESFDVLERAADADILGAEEQRGVAAFWSWRPPHVRPSGLLSVSWFIAKPDTPFTRMWYSRLIRRLDLMRPLIEAHPGTGTYGISPGTWSTRPDIPYAPDYPLPYFSVGPELFHYTCAKMARVRPGSVLSGLRTGREWAPYK